VYAVALHDAGDRTRATAVLEEAYRRRPANREVLVALVTYLSEKGNAAAALRYATALADLAPGDRDVQRLVESLQRAPR
jgi:cytochrome c-type biogenesis protein CcmH/NrfG